MAGKAKKNENIAKRRTWKISRLEERTFLASFHLSILAKKVCLYKLQQISINKYKVWNQQIWSMKFCFQTLRVWSQLRQAPKRCILLVKSILDCWADPLQLRQQVKRKLITCWQSSRQRQAQYSMHSVGIIDFWVVGRTFAAIKSKGKMKNNHVLTVN